MTDPSSAAGHPDGGGLPADHPLGPAVPIPPREKEAARADDAGTPDSGDPTPLQGASHTGSQDDRTEVRDDAAPVDRREDVLDPSAGAAGHSADTIREEQGTHSAGTVPAAFNGPGSPENPDEDRQPEDAASEPDAWDSGGSQD